MLRILTDLGLPADLPVLRPSRDPLQEAWVDSASADQGSPETIGRAFEGVACL
ncbi:MAG: hypothetical protein AB7O28_15795 [Vicinamibacterales bacterium]